MERFAAHHAVVTGGTSGIGAAVVRALRAEGATVTAVSWSEKEIASCRADAAFAGVAFSQVDVSDAAAVDRFASSVPKIDILVNCAGITVRGAEAFEEEGFLRIIDINLTGTMRTCRAC